MKFMGNDAKVILNNKTTIMGVLFDEDDEYLYIQTTLNTVSSIPKRNISHIDFDVSNISSKPKADPEQAADTQPQVSPESLNVFVDGELISDILANGINLASYSPDIMDLAMNNASVIEELKGKNLEKAEYYPGKLYITTVNKQTSFDMSNPMVNRYMTPIELAARIKPQKRGDQ